MKKIDYFKLLKDSAEFTWKYKVLWLFGFIITLFSGSGGGSTSNYNFSNDDISESDFSNVSGRVQNLINTPYFWIILIAVIILSLVFVAVSWYLRRVSDIALLNSVRYDKGEQYPKITIKNLWKGSHPYLMKFLKFDLLYLLIIFPILIFLIILIVVPIIVYPSIGIFLICCSLPIFMLVTLIFNILKQTIERILFFSRLKIIDSIKEGFLVLKNNLGKYALAYLTQLLPGCIFSIVKGFLSIIAVLPFIAIILAAVINPDIWWFSIGSICCGTIVFWIVIAGIQAPYTVFVRTFWTRFIINLISDDAKIKNVEEAEIVN